MWIDSRFGEAAAIGVRHVQARRPQRKTIAVPLDCEIGPALIRFKPARDLKRICMYVRQRWREKARKRLIHKSSPALHRSK
jgi:hypothetical protein